MATQTLARQLTRLDDKFEAMDQTIQIKKEAAGSALGSAREELDEIQSDLRSKSSAVAVSGARAHALEAQLGDLRYAVSSVECFCRGNDACLSFTQTHTCTRTYTPSMPRHLRSLQLQQMSFSDSLKATMRSS
jgi:hypothetical protein